MKKYLFILYLLCIVLLISACKNYLPAPSGLIATSVSPYNVELKWNAVPGAKCYSLHRSTKQGEFVHYGQTVNCKCMTYCNDTKVGPGMTYFYTVKTLKSAEDYVKGLIPEKWPVSDEVTVITPVPTPTNLTARAISSSQIVLNWNTVPKIQAYQILMSRSSGKEKPLTSWIENSYTVTNLAFDTNYYFTIRAWGPQHKSDFSNEAKAKTLS
ncbi:MAG: fibronectin type III domain-containing protein [Candidatus Woesearchaeota archaeon]|nr:fibronectin type III domain-containing protein [Candidatus Woesearchaeota archaeon]MDP7458480.1 fibronectin type III domain-containing protein [Candidatus Woesearchaeota archaeon]